MFSPYRAKEREINSSIMVPYDATLLPRRRFKMIAARFQTCYRKIILIAFCYELHNLFFHTLNRYVMKKSNKNFTRSFHFLFQGRLKKQQWYSNINIFTFVFKKSLGLNLTLSFPQDWTIPYHFIALPHVWVLHTLERDQESIRNTRDRHCTPARLTSIQASVGPSSRWYTFIFIDLPQPSLGPQDAFSQLSPLVLKIFDDAHIPL